MKVMLEINTVEDSADDVHALINIMFGGKSEAKAPTAAEKKAAKAAEKAAAKETAEAEEKPTSVHSIDQVRAKLKEYAALEGKEKAIQILKDNGADSIGELDEAKFDDVVAACGD